MDKPKESPKQELRGFEWKDVPGTPTIYANFFHLGWTLDDVRIALGNLRGENVSTKNHYAELAGTVIMSWRQVKNLNESLTHLLKSYEEANGAITTPYLAVVGDGAKKLAEEKKPS